MELSSSALDSQSCFEAFDQYSYEIEEGKASFVGFKEFSLGDLYDLDLIADSDASSAVYTRFSCEYDYENSIVTLNALLVSDVETVVLDTMYGVIFMNDDMEFDVAFDCDGEILLLSEMREAGMLDEVGLFSKIGSTLKKVWNTTSGKIGTIATVAACAAVGAVCAVVPGGQLITAVCIGVAVGAVGGAVTAAAATYEADGEVDWEAVGICAGVGAAVGGAVSAASYGITTAIKTAVQTAKAGTSCSGGSCFVAGTQILTENGYVAIENIEVGNFVWANNPVTGKTALKEVVQIFRNVTTEWVHVTVNGEEIVCTPTHPFYSPARGWISAGELKKGDILLTAQNEFVSVGKIDVEELETPEITYNFEVEGFHTYFVGENAVLVHNACPKELFSKLYDKEKCINHMFSKDHINNGILELGKSKTEIFETLQNIVFENQSLWKAGSNVIQTVVNGKTVSITFYVVDGLLQNIDAFIGVSERIYNNLINLLG